MNLTMRRAAGCGIGFTTRRVIQMTGGGTAFWRPPARLRTLSPRKTEESPVTRPGVAPVLFWQCLPVDRVTICGWVTCEATIASPFAEEAPATVGRTARYSGRRFGPRAPRPTRTPRRQTQEEQIPTAGRTAPQIPRSSQAQRPPQDRQAPQARPYVSAIPLTVTALLPV